MSTHFLYAPREVQEELRKIAKTLSTPGKGVIPLDESVHTTTKRFQDINLENTEENRRRYRQMVLTTDPKISRYVSGVILFHEGVYQVTDDGVPFIELLKRRGIVPGVKVDTGLVPLFGCEGEFTTQGLDDLEKRCSTYKKEGCHFSKWRCILKIGKHAPSFLAIEENANVLARFASISQSCRLVPVLEVVVWHEGLHGLDRCQKVAESVLVAIYKALNDHHVLLEGSLLKTNVVMPGGQHPVKSTTEQVSVATLVTLARTVPPAVPGIFFLSGSQTDEDATQNLNSINKCEYFCRCKTKPWTLSFSFGRALLSSALRVWAGQDENAEAAQGVLLNRCKLNSLASLGEYIPDDFGDQEGIS